jgi:hypothetical protein
VGAVLGAVGSAALLLGAALWAFSRLKKQQQQRQQVEADSKAWDEQRQQVEADQADSKAWDENQQLRPGVINLNADAVMCISGSTVRQKGWERSWTGNP